MKVDILTLRPTQFAVGMLEVDEKIKIIEEGGKKARRKYVKEHEVPVVLSPQGEMYVVDHHHFLCVCYQLGIDRVRVRIVQDLSRSKMSYASFWKWMFHKRNAYPFCQFGEGPRKALYLPKDIRGLADDPYRSLAWFVRKAGAFENSDRNFAEFRWANFFRERKLLDRFGPLSMPQALIKAVKLAQSVEAKGLPGYGKLNLEEKAVVIEKVKKKGRALKEKETRAA